MLISFLCAAWSLQAQLVATATPDSNRILIGDHLNIRLDASVPQGHNLIWPKLNAPWGKLELLEASPIDTVSTTAELMYSQDLLVSAFDSGLVILPELQFVARDQQNRQPLQTRTQRVPIAVSTIAVIDTMPMAPIKEILIVESSWRDHIWLLFGLLVFAAIVGMFLFWFIKKNRKKAAPKLPAEDPLPRKIAENIQANPTSTPARLEAQYAELAYALKLWLADRYDVKALDKPTRQVEIEMQQSQMPEETKAWAADLLHECDQIKFAKSAAQQEEIQAHAQAFLERIQAEKRTYIAIDE